MGISRGARHIPVGNAAGPITKRESDLLTAKPSAAFPDGIADR